MTESASADARVEAATRMLVDHGISRGEISAEGLEGEIASIRLPEELLDFMLASDAGEGLAADIRGLGFRYVALDLLPADDER